MFVYSVLSPEVFSAEAYESKHHQGGFRGYCRGLARAQRPGEKASNSVLVVDSEGTLIKEFQRQAELLPIKFKQTANEVITGFAISLRNKQGRGVIRISKPMMEFNDASACADLCRTIAKFVNADAIMVTSEEEYRSAEDLTCSLVPMADYHLSDYEEKRRSYAENMPMLHEMDPGDFKDAIVRATKFSGWLRFYDKQIGKGNNVGGFLSGLEHIIGVWTEAAQVPRNTVEIITVESEKIPDDEDARAEDIKRGIRKNIKKVRDGIVAPLEEQFPGLEIKLSVKENDGRSFHPRHLETQLGAFLFERGFDIFNPGTEEFRATEFKLDMTSLGYLRQYRSAPESSQIRHA